MFTVREICFVVISIYLNVCGTPKFNQPTKAQPVMPGQLVTSGRNESSLTLSVACNMAKGSYRRLSKWKNHDNGTSSRSQKRNSGQVAFAMGLLCNGTARSARILGRHVDGGAAISFRVRLAIHASIPSAHSRPRPRWPSLGDRGRRAM